MRLIASPSLAPLAVVLTLTASACLDPSIDSTTELSDTIDEAGPYSVRSIVVGAQSGDQVELFYNSIDREPEHYLPIVMQARDDDGRAGELFVGNIPGQGSDVTIRYYVAVERDGERLAEDPVGGDLRPFVFRIAP